MSSVPPGGPSRARATFLLLGLGVAGVDHLAKWAVVHYLPPGQSVPVLGPVMSLTRQTNTGALFSLFSGGGVYLAAAGLVLTGVLLVWGLTVGPRQGRFLLPLGLLLGGSLGNLVDRLARGHVVDFLDFHFWPVFNLADIALTVGALLAVYQVLFTELSRGHARPREVD